MSSCNISRELYMSNEVMYIVSSVINNIAPAMIASATQNQPKEEIFNKGTLNSANEPSANKPVAKETALEQNSKYKDKTSEEVLSSIVEGFSELSNDIKKDLIHKYETILDFAKQNGQTLSDEKIQKRMTNYAKGLQYHQIESNFADAWKNDAENSDLKMENKDVEGAVKNGDMEKFKQAFHDAAQQYIELHDNAQGDGYIDIKELAVMEEKELGRKLTKEEQKIVIEEAINRIAVLDQNGDNKLDEDEIAAYLWAMSKVNDGENGKTAQDITYEEWKTSQESMGILTLGDDATKEDKIKYAKFAQALDNGYEGLKRK